MSALSMLSNFPFPLFTKRGILSSPQKYGRRASPPAIQFTISGNTHPDYPGKAGTSTLVTSPFGETRWTAQAMQKS
jgi:hypothetical protein